MGDWSTDDHRHMSRALQLARRGLYSTDPNPRVGCVLTRGGEVIGEGWHARAGGDHAEAAALNAVGGSAAGATAYVTLEPCAHHGRTPPCAVALIRAGVARVVIATPDPGAEAGGGAAQLAEAGVAVSTGLMADAAEALNPGFFKRQREGLPWVRVKLAASLDGRTAMASGESRWITGDAARADVHRLRARSSAMLTGVETVLADDPRLTARGVDGEIRQPARYVFDSRLRTPTTAQVVADGGGVTLLCCWPDADRQAELEAAGATVRPTPPGPAGRVDPVPALAAMARNGVNEVMVECGPTLAGALVQAELVDEIVLYLAAHLMGDEGRPLLRLPGLGAMADRLPLRVADLRVFGDDIRIIARPAAPHVEG